MSKIARPIEVSVEEIDVANRSKYEKDLLLVIGASDGRLTDGLNHQVGENDIASYLAKKREAGKSIPRLLIFSGNGIPSGQMMASVIAQIKNADRINNSPQSGFNLTFLYLGGFGKENIAPLSRPSY